MDKQLDLPSKKGNGIRSIMEKLTIRRNLVVLRQLQCCHANKLLQIELEVGNQLLEGFICLLHIVILTISLSIYITNFKRK